MPTCCSVYSPASMRASSTSSSSSSCPASSSSLQGCQQREPGPAGGGEPGCAVLRHKDAASHPGTAISFEAGRHRSRGGGAHACVCTRARADGPQRGRREGHQHSRPPLATTSPGPLGNHPPPLAAPPRTGPPHPPRLLRRHPRLVAEEQLHQAVALLKLSLHKLGRHAVVARLRRGARGKPAQRVRMQRRARGKRRGARGEAGPEGRAAASSARNAARSKGGSRPRGSGSSVECERGGRGGAPQGWAQHEGWQGWGLRASGEGGPAGSLCTGGDATQSCSAAGEQLPGRVPDAITRFRRPGGSGSPA
jgi:hypothetical protein